MRGYPWTEEFAVGARTQDWHAGLLLPWVGGSCQKVRRRYELIRSLDEAYNGADTPALFRSLTRLAMPVYLYPTSTGLSRKLFRKATCLCRLSQPSTSDSNRMVRQRF